MDHRGQVLLRRTEDGAFVEIAPVVSRGTGKELVIRNSDGSEQAHVRATNEIVVERGSVLHSLRVAPGAVRQALRDRPAELFKQMLAEAGKPTKASALKSRLHGIDSRLVDKAWDAARRTLDQDDEVQKSNERVPTYKLSAGAAERSLHVAGLGPQLIDGPGAPAADAESATRSKASELEQAPVSRTIEVQTSDVPADPQPIGAPEPAQHLESLAQRLRELEILSPEDDLSALARTPLSLGIELAKIKAPELRTLVAEAEPGQRLALSLVLGPGKERVLEPDAKRLTAGQHEAVVRSGLWEIANASQSSRRLVPTLADLTKRAVGVAGLPVDLLLELSRVFTEARQVGQEGLDVCLVALARAVPDTTESSLAAWDLGKVALAARAAEFSRQGGRSALVVALHRVVPNEVGRPRWWEGITFDQLVEAGRGPLAAVLEDPAIASQVVRPVVEDAVRRTTTRSGLARLWLAPPVVATWVVGHDLKEAMLRTGTKDPIAGRWAQELTDVGEIEAVTGLLETAQAEAKASRDAEETLRAQVAALESQLRVIGEQLAGARGQQSDLRGAHERQLKLELVRTVARLAAQVGQSPAASTDQSLMRSVEHAAAREGLAPIGRAGDIVGFDPARHDPLGQAIPEHSAVVVLRHGYTWSDGPEAMTILKAQVVPDGG
ncbi:hypothetical protein [Marmoricola sp. URHB0036]|uniref:hypothetical protein n=1 Tax=Marmoricola sp. URHB0036 TaxID=1298863 RepID=UPI00040D406F|nr:hypothetical protein [Marmoricola sp. URHB0036]